MKEPLISVIVPVYNTEKFVAATISSILKQSFTDYEIVLVDDGSVDKSGEICKKFSDEHDNIHYYYQSNQGPAAARKAGVEKANGTFVLFLDADDMLPADSLSLLSDSVSDDLDVVIGFNDAEEAIPKKSPLYMSGDELLDKFLKRELNVDPAAKLWRRRLFGDDIFISDRSIKIGEDFLMNIRLSHKVRKALLLYRAVSIYVRHEGQVTRTFNYSLAYEKMFDKVLLQALQGTKYKKSSLVKTRLYKLRSLVRFGYESSMKDPFVDAICKEAIKYRLSIEDFVFVLFRRNVSLCSYLLQKIAGIKRRVFGIYH